MIIKYTQFILVFTWLLGFLSAESKMWVFFINKENPDGSYVHLDEKSLLRRQKINLGYTWYDKEIPQSYLSEILGTGAIIMNKSRWLNAVSVSGTREQLDMIHQFPFVKKMHPVAVYRHKPDDFLLQNSGITRSQNDSSLYGFSWEQITQINAHSAHNAGFYGQGIRVLVLDTGFNTTLTVFDSLTIIDEWDFINDDNNTANETDIENDNGQHNHGTMVLSTLAGYDKGKLVGPAFGAEILLAKTEDISSESIVEEDNYVAALEWGEQNGADVASSSLGYLDWYSYCDMDGNTGITTIAVDIAVKLGMVCVTAAGNWGTVNPPENPCDTTLYYYISAPADADSVIAVGAVAKDGSLAPFSSHGPTYDGRIKPEVCARGVSTWCVSPYSNSYRTASGTSLSAPLVGGAVAVILSAHPDWTPMEVREALMMTANQSDSPDNNYGYGIIDLMAAIDYKTSSIEKNGNPTEYSILDVYPNPFNSTATIHYFLTEYNYVTLAIYDLKGRLIRVLIDGKITPGKHEIKWNASGLSNGIYFLEMKTESNIRTKKITFLK